MADAKFEEAIRLAFETSGTEGIKQAAGIIANLSGVSEEAKQHAAALLDEIGATEKTGKAVNQYQQLGKSVLDYQRQINEAKAKVVELANAQKEGEAPTKAQERELAKARSTLSTLVGEQQREIEQLRTLKTQIEGQGVSLRSAGAAQRDLAAHSATASANLRTLVGNLRATREAEASNQAELAASAAKARGETAQYDAALKKVRQQLDENKHASVEGSKAAVEGLEKTRGMLDRLREPLAALGAYFSFEALKEGVKSIFETGGQFAKFERQLSGLYGTAEKGKEAFEWVKQFTTGTPYKLDEVMSAFVRLKKFGIDPMGGALQAIVDQNAKLGGSSEQLEAITTALTKATVKGQLDIRELIKLTEAGVPVFDMLAKATGQTTDRIRDMAAQGLLGADSIKTLLHQMGQDATGGAANAMDQLTSQWTLFTENVDDFRDRVAKKGVLDWFKDQLKGLNDLIGRMAADGRLDQYAKRISDGIIRIADAIKSTTKYIADHASTIANLAKAYAAFKIGGILLELGAFASKLLTVARGAIAGTAAIEGLSGGMVVFRTAVVLLSGPIGWIITALGAFAVAAHYAAEKISDYAYKHGEAAKKMAEADAKYKSTMQSLSDEWGKRAAALAEYQDVQLQTAEQMAKMTAGERAAYKARLDGYIEYTRAIWKQTQLQAAAHHDSSEETVKDIEAQQKAFIQAQAAITDYNDVMTRVASAVASSMSVSASYIVDSIKGVQNSTEELKKQLSGLFVDFGKNTAGQMGDIALALADVGNTAGYAGIQIRQGIRENIAALSSEDLLTFQQSSNAAFTSFNVDAKQASVVVEATLHAALTRLGVTADQWGEKTTEAGQQNIAAFQVVATNAVATSVAITAAFNKALANATTPDDAKAIGDAMQKAGQQGAVGFDATQRAVAAVENRVRALKTALDPLADDFARLGIRSQRALDDAAAAAKHSFDNIVRGARDGKASMNDVRAAFDGYAKAQLDSVAHAEAWKRSQVKSALETQASILGVSDELAGMGAAGLDAGDHIAHGAHVASEALHDTAAAASDAQKTTEKAGDAAESYATKMANAHQEQARQWVATGARTQVAISGLSNTFLQALADLNKYASHQEIWRNMWNNTVAEWRRQGTAVDELVAKLDKQNAVYDEIQQRVNALRQTYNYLNEDQLRALAQAQSTLEQNQKRAEDEAKQKRTERAQKAKDDADKQTAEWNKELGIGADGGGRAKAPVGPDGVHRIALDLNVSASQAPGAVPAQLSPTDVQKVANEVVRQIGIARTMSNR